MAKRKQARVGLIDGDILAYEISAVNEVRINWEQDRNVSQYPLDLEAAQEQADKSVGHLIDILNLDRVVICLSDKNNFRKAIYPEYKSNRKDAVRPVLLNDIKDYLEDTYETYKLPNLEADDVLGILATHQDKIPGKKIIISIDKDLTQIPGYYFNPNKHGKEITISKSEGDRFHYLQTLTGDNVDGYLGCPGIGPKKAEVILNGEDGNEWSRIVRAYENKKLTEADALVQAQIARILQADNYDFATGEITYWQPKLEKENAKQLQ